MQIVHEVTCAWPPCTERVGTSESFNALAFLLSDLGWTEVGGSRFTGPADWYCPLHNADGVVTGTFWAICSNCDYEWDEPVRESDFPGIRSEHSKTCFNDSHYQCRSGDVEFRPVKKETAIEALDRQKKWAQQQLESDAYDRYVEFLIARDQEQRVQDEIDSSRSRFIRGLLRLADHFR